MSTICGINCSECELKTTCGGCEATGGHPFGGSCVVAECCHGRDQQSCGECTDCSLRRQIISEFNALGIADMGEVQSLNLLLGSFINSEYLLPSGVTVKLWEDGSVYFANMLPKQGSEQCYGIAADVDHLAVTEFGENGSDPKLVLFKRR